jgi:O-antigen/teichoic acid export membrane protein
MHTGAGFWLIQIASLLEQNGGAFVLAHYSGPQSVAMFAIAFKTLNLAGSAVGIFTQPLWPSFTDAIVRHDLAWVEGTFRKIRGSLITAAFGLAAVWVVLSDWMFLHVFHTAVRLPLVLAVAFALYLVSNMWTHVYYISLMGIGNIWTISAVNVAENFLMLGLGIILASRYGALGMVGGYLLASVLLPFWLLPRVFGNRIERARRDVTAAVAATGLSS